MIGSSPYPITQSRNFRPIFFYNIKFNNHINQKQMSQQIDHIGDVNEMITAVEWLIERLAIKTSLYTKDELVMLTKEMEKQQIMQAYQDGYNHSEDRGWISSKRQEQYYNETYKRQTS